MQTDQPKLPPGADVVFRRLFDEENDCRLLISLLNALLLLPAKQRIRKLTLVRTQLAGPLADDKEVILDVRAESDDGRQFSIEVQISSQPGYPARMLFYWAGQYHGQVAVGQGYSDLRPVICIHILFFVLFADPDHAAYHHVFRAQAEDGAILSPHFELHTLEMTKFPDLSQGQDAAGPPEPAAPPPGWHSPRLRPADQVLAQALFDDGCDVRDLAPVLRLPPARLYQRKRRLARRLRQLVA